MKLRDQQIGQLFNNYKIYRRICAVWQLCNNVFIGHCCDLGLEKSGNQWEYPDKAEIRCKEVRIIEGLLYMQFHNFIPTNDICRPKCIISNCAIISKPQNMMCNVLFCMYIWMISHIIYTTIYYVSTLCAQGQMQPLTLSDYKNTIHAYQLNI